MTRSETDGGDGGADEQADRLEEQADRLEEHSEDVDREVEGAKRDWESKQQDADVPGAQNEAARDEGLEAESGEEPEEGRGH